MHNFELIQTKLRLECIQVRFDASFKRLERIDGNTCDDIEKLFIALDPNGQYYVFFGDYSLGERYSYISHDPKEYFESELAARQIVATPDLRRELWYFFDNRPKIEFPLVAELGDTPDTLDTFAILENGDWVARAWSVRRNERSAEIAVETKETHRRKGFGSQVVSAWANSQISKGKIGIYGHRKYNLESKYLAEKVGAVLFADVLSLQ